MTKRLSNRKFSYFPIGGKDCERCIEGYYDHPKCEGLSPAYKIFLKLYIPINFFFHLKYLLQIANVMKEDLLAKLVITILVDVHVNLILLVPNVISVMRDTMDGHGQIANVSIFLI